MGTEKRARQKANRQTKVEAEQAEAKSETREQTTRRVGMWVGIVAAIIAIFVLFNVLTGGDDASSDTIAFTPTPVPEGGELGDALASEIPSDFAAFAGSGALARVEPTARDGAYDSAPAMTIDPTATYRAAITTDVGILRLTLFADETPITVNNFVNLAEDGFYDGLTFHRVIDGFMAQGGDPTGFGSGGPGYNFEDEVDTGRSFDSRGLLAMANAGPGTNGSQFFITFAPTPHLDGAHTIFGIVEGDDSVLDAIVRDGGGESTTITSIRIAEL